MTMKDLTGTFAALYTPFDEGGLVDVGTLRALAGRLVDAGVGLVPCGTTGETPTLTPEEYEIVVRTAVEASGGRVPVIAGTGSNNTRAAIRQTRTARELGVDAALVVTPYYNKPPQRSLVAHFTAIADEAELPMILYNVPSRTGCNMTAATTLELAKHPRVVAVKEASGDFEQIQRIIFERPEGFKVLSGDDAVTLPMVLAGGDGVISVAANVVPREMKALTDAALSGDLAGARKLQGRLLPLFRALFLTSNPIPLKHAASLLGHSKPHVRLPLSAEDCTEAMSKALADALATARGAMR